ncbi:lipopolysaccharide biosynthesis protein [Psychroflexus salis]|uniref:Capsular polysaccharide biosynthesis protein n=1 Tax=Psychroflexus salis TaxID=1526574 RepID=A0A916ZS20_9FLAO|nr:polysaccharide biosynthesis C-terminal domain-containing protein [Psychroflexus salis]GGE11340.1 capsular polysaccharide biosynthesis protein [Psychroflexus salis]
MGIILKQSFSNLVSTYVGFGIGAINVLLLYPNFMQPEYYGLVSYLLTAGNLLWPFMALGVHNTLIKFFSAFTQKKDQDRLLSIVLITPLIFGSVFGGIGIYFYNYILNYFEGENNLVQPYAWLIFIIAISTAYFEVFFSWNKIFLKSMFGNIMKEVFHRVGIFILLMLLYFNSISIHFFIYASALVYVLRALVMMFSAFKTYMPKFQFRFPVQKREIINYSFLIFIAGTVGVALFDLDKFMIEHFLPIENVAVYGIAIYIAAVISAPLKAMQQITNPITAEFVNQNKKEELTNLYKRTSLTLLIVSGLIFVLIISNINQLYALIPETYHAGVQIVFLISLVKLFDSSLGNNVSILFNSNYYHFVLYSGVALAVLAFVLNLWLIPIYGIYGAAYATFIAFFLYNLIKLIFVYLKFNIQPFTKKSIWIISLICVFLLLFYFWDFSYLPLVNIILKSIIIVIAYVSLTFVFRLSEDITGLLASAQKTLKK